MHTTNRASRKTTENKRYSIVETEEELERLSASGCGGKSPD